jgi:hypothetical protein
MTKCEFLFIFLQAGVAGGASGINVALRNANVNTVVNNNRGRIGVPATTTARPGTAGSNLKAAKPTSIEVNGNLNSKPEAERRVTRAMAKGITIPSNPSAKIDKKPIINSMKNLNLNGKGPISQAPKLGKQMDHVYVRSQNVIYVA